MTINLVVDRSVTAEDIELLSAVFSRVDQVVAYPIQSAIATLAGNQRKLNVFVGSAIDGPMGYTIHELQAAHQRDIHFDALVLLGEVEDEELAELVELEFRELLGSRGYDGESFPILRVRNAQQISFGDIEALVLQSGLRPDQTEPTGLDAADWLLVRTAAGGEGRMETLSRSAAIRNLHFEREVERALPEVFRYWNRRSTVTWLALPNRHLHGAAPIDALALEGAEEVVGALWDEVWGEFI